MLNYMIITVLTLIIKHKMLKLVGRHQANINRCSILQLVNMSHLLNFTQTLEFKLFLI
jgi:hypothetical protein